MLFENKKIIVGIIAILLISISCNTIKETIPSLAYTINFNLSNVNLYC